MTNPSHPAPEDLGFSAHRLQAAYERLDQAAARGHIPASVLLVGRRGRFLAPHAAGNARPDSVFLVASITKPVTATAVMLLVESGRLTLEQPVVEVIPEFRHDGKEDVRVWHLLTHTSGLPDMLPNNVALRQAHASLSQFMQHIYQAELLFPPGTDVRYQSCGFAVLGEMVERLSEMPLRDFLRRHLFVPIGMERSALGIRDELRPHLVEVALTASQTQGDWHWNSEYWRQLGVPWGGMFSTARDLGRFLQMFLDRGRVEGDVILSPATVEAMTRDQLAGRPSLPPAARLPTSWGLGWAVPGRYAGDLISPGTFGHGGATGTMAWADPVRQVTCVLLTNQPGVWQQDGRFLAQMSNLVAAACL